MIVALERFVDPAFRDELKHRKQWLTAIAYDLSDTPGVEVSLSLTNLGDTLRHLELRLQKADAVQFSRALKTGDPAIKVSEARIDEAILVIKSGALKHGDSKVIADRIKTLLMR